MDPIRRSKAIVNQYNKRYIVGLKRDVEDAVAGKFALRYCLLILDPSDVNHLIGLAFNITGEEDEFVGGEYLFEMSVDKNRGVLAPPMFRYFTPNGVYGPGQAPCLNIGHEHPENFSPALIGLEGFANMTIEAMRGHAEVMGSLGGRNMIRSKAAEKRKLAAESRAYNEKHYPQYMQMIKDHIAEHSAYVLSGLAHYSS